MKNKLGLVLGVLLFFSQAAMAQTAFQVTAQIPAATGLLLTEATYLASTGAVVGTPSTTATTIPFGQLNFNTTNNIYVPTNYYSIAVGVTGGAGGTPIVNVTYTEGTGTQCPNIAAGLSATLGCLGTKTTATFVTADSATNAETVSSVGKVRLIDLTGNVGKLTSIPSGQYEKIYVSVWAGGTSSPADPANGIPFTNADAPGQYSGTLTFTVVTL